jgi:hypothetical protein
MTEFAKIASAIKLWGWGRTWTILTTLLLSKHVVTFDQALILLLLNLVCEGFVYGKRPMFLRSRSSSVVPTKRRPPKLPRPIKDRPVRASDGLAFAAAEHSIKIGAHRK